MTVMRIVTVVRTHRPILGQRAQFPGPNCEGLRRGTQIVRDWQTPRGTAMSGINASMVLGCGGSRSVKPPKSSGIEAGRLFGRGP